MACHKPRSVAPSPYQPARRNRGATLNAQRLSVTLIDHVQGHGCATVVHRVAHEVQDPDAVEDFVRHQRFRSRVTTRFLALRCRFSFMAQYTLCIFLWFQPYPSARSRWKHFQKPQRLRWLTISFRAAITGASLAAQSTVGLYNADREKPTIRQAL